MIRRLAFSLSLFAAVVLLGSCGKKTPTLNLLVWEGYADPSFVQGFEEKYHCKISASYMGSSDELVAKLRGGSAGKLRCDLAFERRCDFHRGGWPGSAARSFADSQLQPALAAAHFPAPGAHERTGVWRALHVGTRSADLRHHSFPQTSGELDRVLGPEVSRQDFSVG